jgi:transposase
MIYERKSRLTPRQQGRLIEYFVTGATARAAGEVVGVQANTAARFFMRLRHLIASKLPSYELGGEIEADESYFGGVRKGRRGRGAAEKIAVFGLLKRRGKVFTAIIPNAKTETLLPIIQEKVTPDSIVYTDTFRSYNALDVSDFRHLRINHSNPHSSDDISIFATSATNLID